MTDDDDDNETLQRGVRLEGAISEVLCESGLPVFVALIALSIASARVLYGVEVLCGPKQAKLAHQALSCTTMFAWAQLAEISKPDVVH
jgi:hypothetical protein